MIDIFLSYSEKDRDEARRVASTLAAVGWTVWWDRRIPAGETWRNVLEKALAEMRCMVVLWSAQSITSEWVYEEASEGRRQHKLFPVLIEAVRPPTGFREIQAADLTGWDGSPGFEGMRLLINDLENVLGRPQRTAPAAGDTAATKRPPIPDPPADGPSDGPGNDPVNNPAHSRTDSPAVPSGGAHAVPRWPLSRAQTWMATGALLVAVAVASLSLFSAAPVVEPRPPPDSTVIPLGEPSPRPAAAVATVVAPAAVPPAAASPTRQPPVSAAVPVRPAAGRRAAATPAAGSRCADLLARVQLGEPLADAEQAALREECRK